MRNLLLASILTLLAACGGPIDTQDPADLAIGTAQQALTCGASVVCADWTFRSCFGSSAYSCSAIPGYSVTCDGVSTYCQEPTSCTVSMNCPTPSGSHYTMSCTGTTCSTAANSVTCDGYTEYCEQICGKVWC